MATLPFFQQRAVARRKTSDIERLAKQYKQQVDQMTGQYQQAYGQYQAQAAEQLNAYESKSTAFKTAYDKYSQETLLPYQTALDEFNRKSAIYNKELEDISAGRMTRYSSLTSGYQNVNGRSVYTSYLTDPFSGQQLDTQDVLNNPQKYGYSSVLTPVQGGFKGENKYTFIPLPRSENPSMPKAPEAFAETAPEAPQIGEFDTAQFDEKRAQLESSFKREVGERKAGRLAAVSRRVARPLLQGG